MAISNHISLTKSNAKNRLFTRYFVIFINHFIWLILCFFAPFSFLSKKENANIRKYLVKWINQYYNIINQKCTKINTQLLIKINQIEELVSNVEEFADSIPKVFKQKLEERLKDLLGNVEVDENRIATEVCILADKATVDEEIIRLNSHINQVRETLKLNEPIGRKLDFIVQEMNRETNTIGSKSSDIKMTNIVIDIKNILEKIREQVQNIE